MKSGFKIFFLKLRKYLLTEEIEKFLILIIFLLGILIIFLANFEIKKFLPPLPKYGGIYREGVYEEVRFLNPLSPANDTEKAILNIVFPSFIELDNGKLISKFIKNYYLSADGLTYTFQLKDNLKWSEGSDLTSEDILFSFKLFKKDGPAEIISLFKDVELEAIDQRTIVFHLKTNDNYFLYNLKFLKPLPAKIFSSGLPKFPEFLKIGSGPFVFESLIKNGEMSYLILKRNELYQPRPYLDKIVFYLYPSARRAFDGLFLKEIDGLAGLNYFNLPANIFFNYKVYKITLPRVIGIFFNSKKVSSEEASFWAKNIDRDFLVENIFKNYAEKSEGLFSQTLRKILKISQPKIDFGKTKESKQITLITPSSYFYPEIARYLRNRFNSQIEFVSQEVLNEKIKNKDYEAILMGLNFSHPPFLSPFFSLAGLNLNNLENLELEKSFQNISLDPKIDWGKTVSKIEDQILREKMNIFLVNPYYLFFLNKKFSGFDQIYLFEPAARFVKIEYWFKK